MNDIVKGFGTPESPLAAAVLATDSRAVLQCLIDDGNYPPRTTHVPFSTYYDRDYAALELSFPDFDEYFESLAEWQPFSTVLDQDMRIIPRIQAGLRAAAGEKPTVELGRYQEQRVALLHEFVEEKIAEGKR